METETGKHKNSGDSETNYRDEEEIHDVTR